MTTSNNTYPVNCSVEYPESSSRILALLGFVFWIKLVALIPHFIVLYFLGIISLLMTWFVYLWVAFAGKYPRGLFDFQVGVIRWDFRVSCWIIGLTDKYPPFSFEEGGHPTDVSVEYPESSSRILALLGFVFWIKLVALIPHFIVLYFLSIISLLLTWIGYLAVIFTGKYPRGLFDFQVGVIRWDFRVSCWVIGLTDKYPPFSLK